MFFYIEFPRALGRSEAPLTKMFAPFILKLDAPWAYTRLPVVSVTKKKKTEGTELGGIELQRSS